MAFVFATGRDVRQNPDGSRDNGFDGAKIVDKKSAVGALKCKARDLSG
jgi:hypothetical protein